MNRAYSMDWSPNALSPTTTKLALEKNLKKVERLKEELQIEANDKNEIIEENNELKIQINALKKQVKSKTQEIERLKEDLEVCQSQLETNKEVSIQTNRILKDSLQLKEELAALRAEKQLIEKENEELRNMLEESEENIKLLSKEATSIDQQREKFQFDCLSKDAEICRWKRCCSDYEIKINDLNEYNQALSEQVKQLETRKEIDTSLSLENIESLDRELKFQSMQDQIDLMTVNLRGIEEEQSRLLNENEDLNNAKVKFETLVEELKTEKVELEKQSIELGDRLTVLLEENLSLSKENENLKSKIDNAENMIDNFNRRISDIVFEYNETRKKFLTEKEDLESNIITLSQGLHSTTRQLEDALAENKNYEISLQELKTTLQEKITSLLVMTSHCNEVEKTRDHTRKTLQNTEEELKEVQATKNELQKELFSARAFIEQTVEENARKCTILEQKVERHVNELNQTQSLYQKSTTEINQLHRRVTELNEINERQSQLLGDFECRISSLINEKREIETSFEERIRLLEENEREVRSNAQKFEERNINLNNEVQEWRSKYEVNIAERAKVDDELKKLTNENENLSNQLQALSEKLQSATKEIEFLKMLKENIKHQLQETEEANTNLKMDMQEWNRKYEIEVEEKSHINDELRKLTTENHTLLTQLEDISTKFKTIVNELEDLKREKAGTEQRFLEAEASAASLREEVRECALKYHIELEEKSKIQNELCQLSVENQKLEEFSTKLQTVFNEHKENMEASRANNEDLLKQVEEWTCKYNLEVQQKCEIDFQLQALMSKNRDLSTQLEDLSKELQSSLTKSEELKCMKEDTERQLQETLANIESCHKEYLNLKELREVLLDQLHQSQKANADMKMENEKLVESNKEKLQFLKEVEKGVQTVTEEMEKLKLLNEELEKRNTELKQQIDNCCENEFKLKDANIKLDQTVRSLKNEEKHLLLQLEEISSEKDSLCSQLESLKQELQLKEIDRNELQKLVALESNDIQTLKNSETKLFDEIEKLHNQNQKLRSEMDEFVSHIQFFNQENLTMKDEFDTKLKEKEAQLQSVHGSIEEKEKRIDALLKEENTMRQQNERLTDNVKQLQAEIAKIRARVQELTEEKEELYRMDQLNNEALKTTSSKNATLSTENEELRSSLKSLHCEKEAVLERINEMEEKLKSTKQTHAEEVERTTLRLNKERTKLDGLIKDERNRVEQLLKQVETLNVKLAEESQRVNLVQRSHASQLQKQIEVNKSLESKLQHYESNEKDAYSKRIGELKSKLEEALESNECLTDELKSRAKESETLIKENENLLIRIDDLETMKCDLQDARERLLAEKEQLREEQKTLSLKVDSMGQTLRMKEEVIDQLKDEYEVFKEEYRKLAEHKDELENDFKDTMLQENEKLSRRCDELTQAVSKANEQLLEKERIIKEMSTRIEDLEANGCKGSRLDETHVVASGAENELYVTLRQENLKLAEERDSYKEKMAQLEAEVQKEKENYRSRAQTLFEKIGSKVMTEYEGKLQRAKCEFQRKMVQKYEAREKEWKKKEEEYRMMLGKEKEHNKDLNSQNWNIMDQYLQLKQAYDRRCSDVFQDNFLSPATLRKTRSATHLNLLGSRGSLMTESDRRASSLSTRANLLSESDRRLSAMSTISEDFLVPMKKKPTSTSGKRFSMSSAKVFPTEDEEQEIFDNACLADLKQGRMPNDDDSLDFSKQRLSILQARNSLCPPHLKSSYPAETQFIPAQEFKENEIKMGLQQEYKADIENVLPSGDRQKKARNQTSYKKPGPPTPSKNGGRSSGTQVETPKKALRDSNENGNTRRKSFTPKFFNNLFALRGHVNIPTTQQNDENIPLTPKNRRLPSIRRRFSRNPQELGNTNSDYC